MSAFGINNAFRSTESCIYAKQIWWSKKKKRSLIWKKNICSNPDWVLREIKRQPPFTSSSCLAWGKNDYHVVMLPWFVKGKKKKNWPGCRWGAGSLQMIMSDIRGLFRGLYNLLRENFGAATGGMFSFFFFFLFFPGRNRGEMLRKEMDVEEK